MALNWAEVLKEAEAMFFFISLLTLRTKEALIDHPKTSSGYAFTRFRHSTAGPDEPEALRFESF